MHLYTAYVHCPVSVAWAICKNDEKKSGIISGRVGPLMTPIYSALNLRSWKVTQSSTVSSPSVTSTTPVSKTILPFLSLIN